MKRIYISGPMTGLPEFNFPAFHAAAAKLRERGHAAVNPAEINAETGGDWHYYMKADIKALCDCDALALLPGWQNSKGRPHFHYVDGRRAAFNSGAPIALVAYGSANLDALRQSGLGFVVVGHNAPKINPLAPESQRPD